MDTLLRDLRFAARLLVRERVYTLTVLLTLAACVGANVAIFGVVDAVLLEPLPYERADRLVTVYNSYPGAGAERASNGTVDFFQRREHVQAFEEVALFQPSGSTVGETGGVERVSSLRVTPSFFDVLRIEAATGRTFTEEQMEPGRDQEVVLTHAEWQERFGGETGVVGRDLRIDGAPRTIVGILPPGVRLAGQEDARFFLPISFDEDDRALDAWHSNQFSMIARLRDGATLDVARSQVDALNASLVDRWPVPGARQILEDAGFHTEVVDARADLVRDVRGALYLLWGGVGFVLLIGCVNVANLALARAHVRMGEMATRLSLGAERSALARQLVTESLVVAVVGGLLGLGLGALGLRLVTGLGGESLPRGVDVGLGPDVVVYSVLLALLAGLITGAFPAVHAFRSDLGSVFRSESRTGTANRRTLLLRNALVSAQVALAFLLLSGASLMVTSFREAVAVDPGFEAEDVLTGSISLPAASYPDGDAHRRFVDELLPTVRALPGVVAAGMTTQVPFGGNNSSSVIYPEGRAPEPGESLLSPFQTWVTPGYFEAMGIELVEGRTILPSDREDQPRVIVIDEWLARRYWPDRSPLGERMLWGAVPGMEDQITEDNLATIVGVVESVKQNDLTATEHVGAYYFPYAQLPASSFLALVVKTRGTPTAAAASLRDAVSRLDPELPLYRVRTLESRIGESLATRRTSMLLLGVFAGVALLLAVVGLYGSLAYTVAQRTREMGIRVAVGSSPEGIFGLVVGQGIRVTLVGLVVGIGGALLGTRVMESLLFGVRAGDPVLMSAVGGILLSVAAVACVVPAWRATRLDPTEALQGR